MRRDALIERFFNSLISGDRPAARAIIDELLQADVPAERILSRLFWPTLDQIQTLYRNDQMSDLAHHYATRLMRSLADQMQMRLTVAEPRNKKVLLACGPEESEEIGAQILADMLEADGYTVRFAGGGVANDEIVAEVGEYQSDILIVFGVVPSTVPFTRLLIDRLHDLGVRPNLQIAVGGGVFNRAEGLAEEIGADLWAQEPEEMVQLLAKNPEQRMKSDQRTVGRKRRTSASSPSARDAA